MNCMANKTVMCHWEYVISIHPCNISEELASSEDEIDEEGAQYIEKLEKAVSSNWKHSVYLYCMLWNTCNKVHIQWFLHDKKIEFIELHVCVSGVIKVVFVFDWITG